MATDIARISFDSGRKYTDTVPQQGRVSLEAEENEQHAIDHVERLKELLDIVGPAGTPHNGYAVTYNGAGSPQIGPGIMYVGGLRVGNEAAFMYAAQPDWLDSDGDPAFAAPVGNQTVNEHVVLVLTEVDVTATEDPMLLEAALGGPDGAARRRILQRVYRIPTTAADCAGATQTDASVWAADGLTFDPQTMRLDSASSLLVTWDGPPASTDPCEPATAGGYLGADNQAIRVQICAVDAGTFDFVWGWDDASALYQVTADTSANPVLTLNRAPVDDYHDPQSGQPVEVLRSAAGLDSADGVVEGYVASLTGQVAVLSAPYDPDLKQITFPAPLPAPYTNTAETPQLYLRVWQERHQGVVPGTAVPLTGTGLSVTITAAAGGPVHLGDYWTIGVRPSTPATVLPDRLLRTPQPPDGPRMWACPLAVIGWEGGSFTVLADCRVPFPPLTGITAGGGGCCTVSVKPADAAALQQIIDQATAGRTAGDVTQRVTVCLSPGRYELTETLRLTEVHSQLHLEGCGDGAVLAAQPDRESAFRQGLISLLGTTAVRISGITFEPPPVEAEIGASLGAAGLEVQVAIALRPVDATGLSIDNCVFSLVNDQLREENLALIAIGIFTGGTCEGLSVTGCRFTPGSAAGATPNPKLPQSITMGILTSPTLVSTASTTKETAAAYFRVVTGLDDLVITDTRFDGLTVAVLAFAALGGLRIDDNSVRDCYAGFWFISLDMPAYLDLTGSYAAQDVDQSTMTAMNSSVTSLALDPVFLLSYTFGRAYPLPAGYQVPTTAAGTTSTAAITATQWTTGLVRRLTTGSVAAIPAAQDTSKTPAQVSETVQFGTGAATRADLVSGGGPANEAVRAAALTVMDLEQQLPYPDTDAVLMLRFRGNRVECSQPSVYSALGVAAEEGQTALALVVWDFSQLADDSSVTREAISGSPAGTPAGGSLIADGNELTGNCAGPVAMVVLVSVVTFTGNQVRQEDNDKLLSLAVLGVDGGAAITGNVLFGPPLLPAGRPYASPLDTWLPFNTVVY